MKQYKIIYLSVEAASIAIICFMIGEALGNLVYGNKEHIGGIWCMISSLVVLQSIASETLKASKPRIMATIIACIISGIICAIISYSFLSMFLSISISAYVLHILKENDGIRIATATAAVISGFGFLSPDYSAVINSTMRAVDTLVGVGFSVIVVYISYKLKIRKPVIEDNKNEENI